jgi:hypothetical protein
LKISRLIASLSGLGYQTLMRQVLHRFADCEKKRLLREFAAEKAARQKAKAKPTQASEQTAKRKRQLDRARSARNIQARFGGPFTWFDDMIVDIFQFFRTWGSVIGLGFDIAGA